MIRKALICLIVSMILGQGTLFAFSSYQEVQQYYTDEFAKRGITVVHDASMDTKIPTYIQPDITQKKLDIGYRISLLPDEYQNKNEYFIFPKAGIITPIINVTPEEREIMDSGKEIDYLHYLQKGVLHHWGKKPFDGPGNFTIAGHTSYLKSDPGDFKTSMQGIFLADPGDRFLYAIKIDESHRSLYTYKVTKGYEVESTDVSILLPSRENTYEMTVYGCSPIGTIENRRVVKAVLLSSDKVVIQSSVVLSGETLSGEILSGETLSGEILSGEILSGEILSGEILSGEILSGEILSGETLNVEIVPKSSHTSLGTHAAAVQTVAPISSSPTIPKGFLARLSYALGIFNSLVESQEVSLLLPRIFTYLL